MRLDKKKFEIAKARACMSQTDLEKAGIRRSVQSRALKGNITPKTAGKLAKALGVDVTEIIEQ